MGNHCARFEHPPSKNETGVRVTSRNTYFSICGFDLGLEGHISDVIYILKAIIVRNMTSFVKMKEARS